MQSTEHQNSNRMPGVRTVGLAPDIPNPVRTADYNGAGSIDVARGHIVPCFISGGDRDDDGLKAANNQGALADLDDACTIYEVNCLSVGALMAARGQRTAPSLSAPSSAASGQPRTSSGLTPDSGHPSTRLRSSA